MASAAVTAASAAALVPILMSSGCLPAKGASRSFVIERLALLPNLIRLLTFFANGEYKLD